MKNITFVRVILISLIISLLTANQTFASELNKRIRLEEDNVWEATSLSELEKNSELIAEGYLLNDGKLNLQKASDGRIKFGVTISTLCITKVYKGNVKENDTVSIGETYYTEKNKDESYDLYYYSNYLPSKVGEKNKYIFFLNSTPKDGQFGGAYFPVDRENGRYPVLTEQRKVAGLEKLTKSKLCLGADSSVNYRKLLAEVVSKYQNGSTSNTNKSIKYIPIQYDRDFEPKTLKDVETRSEIIVSGKIIDNGVEKVSQKPETVAYAFTIYSFQISKVYKGNLKSGDVIKLLEQHYLDNDNIIYYKNNYLPSDYGKEYLFFLYKTSDSSPAEGGYYPAYSEYGRYPMINPLDKNIDDYTKSELGIGVENAAYYKAIFTEIMGKYMR